jgi:lipopolysaccharide transport system ATP-binding protein
MNDDVVIRVGGLWKRYGLPLVPALRRYWRSLRNGDGWLSADSNPDNDGPWALRDINLEVRRGETLGIIGRNGAGKSTLLKVLAGVTPPTRGKVEVRGRVFPMIELNAGLHRDLTGRENVRLLGAIMGLSRQEIEAKMTAIEEFCELGEWFDRPVRMYSSGMLARLGFGVAMNVDADILLVDEVLAVGDLAFQRKCYSRIERLREQDIAVVLVSHSIRQVERLCETAILLEAGELVQKDTSVRVAGSYYHRADEESRLRIAAENSADNTSRYRNSGELLVECVEVFNLFDEPVDTIRSGDGIRLKLQLTTTCNVKEPIIGIGFISTDMIVVASISNDAISNRPDIADMATLYCTIPELPFNPGTYSVRVKVVDTNGSILFVGHHMTALQVTRALEEEEGILSTGGFVRLNADWEKHSRRSAEI